MEEIRHVELIRGALGKLAVQCPKMDIGPAFAAAANLAFGTTTDPAFSPYRDVLNFLHGALFIEDVAVMAFNGAIGVISSPGTHPFHTVSALHPDRCTSSRSRTAVSLLSYWHCQRCIHLGVGSILHIFISCRLP